jgi:hypothetical protein
VYHRVDELDTVVLGRVVTGSDHDTDGLAIELARAQRGQESNTVDDRVEDVAEDGESVYRTTDGGERHTPSYGTGIFVSIVYTALESCSILTPAVPY